MTGSRDAVVDRVDAELAVFVADRARSLASAGPDLDALLDSARSFVLSGGKRLRPTFAYWGWRTVSPGGIGGAGGSSEPGEAGLITAAASLELLHACALVHDDVMDASDTRRGRPAAHTAFSATARDAAWPGDPDVYGTAAAIVLGDLLLCWADAMFASAVIDASRTAASRQVYDDMRQLVMAGQYLDVLVQARGRFAADDALRVIEFKTSKYTVEGPLLLGASIAGAGPDTFDALSRYGLPLGEAFQLRDDVLGVFGDPAVTGKPAGDDLREGKQTLLTALAVERADAENPEQAELLRSAIGDRGLDVARVEAVRAAIVATGALDEVERRITRRANEARAALDTDSISDAARDALDALAGAAAVRSA